MRNLRVLLVVVSASAAGLGALAALATGCGDDNSVASGDSGTDASGDTTTDAPGDTSPAPEAATDASDGGSADGDGGSLTDTTPDGPLDAGNAVALFPQQVTQAYCQRLATCCAPNDAGFDMNYCYTSTLGQGGVNGDGLGYYAGRIPAEGGAIMFDSAKAQACLQDIAAIPCGIVTSQTYLQIRNDCYAALVGTIAVGGTGCTTTLDCAPQGFCNIVGDAGTGTCVALSGGGGPCTVNEQCTYRGTGQPAQFCDNEGPDAGSYTCVPQSGVDGGCGVTFYYEQECTSELCVSPGVCGTQTVFSDPGVPNGICAGLAPQDAGGGG
jgi:hypothetical protein